MNVAGRRAESDGDGRGKIFDETTGGGRGERRRARGSHREAFQTRGWVRKLRRVVRRKRGQRRHRLVTVDFVVART